MSTEIVPDITTREDDSGSHYRACLVEDDSGAATASLVEDDVPTSFDAALVHHGTAVTEDADGVLDRNVNFPGRPPEPVE